MAQALKNLGSYAGTLTTGISIYKVPASTSTTVSSLVICNNSGASATFRVWWAASGSAAGTTGITAPAATTGSYLYFDVQIDANSTFIATIGITMATLDTLVVSSSTTSMSFNLYGVEVS